MLDPLYNAYFVKKTVKLSSKQHQSSCTWVLSNLKRHFKSSCEIIRKACTESNNELSDNDNNPGTNDTEINGNKSTLVALEIQPVIQNIDEPNDKLNAEFTSYVNSLQTQVKLQKIKMISSVISNGERQKTCEIQLDSKVLSIEVSEIARDGNCLFSAVSHQLDDFKIGSIDHTLASSKLRMDTIAHIKENLSLYERDIKGRIYEQSPKNRIYDVSKRYIEFLDEFLAKDGFWAGSESLKAIAVMMQTNIIVFNEKGDVYFGNKYDPNYKRSIMIVFRITDHQNNDLSNSNRNHYDSVSKVCDQGILKTAERLIKKYSNSLFLQNNSDIIIIN